MWGTIMDSLNPWGHGLEQRCMGTRSKATAPLEGYSWGISAGPMVHNQKQHSQKSKEFLLNPAYFGTWWNDLYRFRFELVECSFFSWWVLIQLSLGWFGRRPFNFSLMQHGPETGNLENIPHILKCVWTAFASNGGQWAGTKLIAIPILRITTDMEPIFQW